MLTNLRRVRQERNLSQRGLARLVGLHQGYIHLLEKGLPPREADHVDRLAEALRVTARLLTGPPLIRLDVTEGATSDVG